MFALLRVHADARVHLCVYSEVTVRLHMREHTPVLPHVRSCMFVLGACKYDLLHVCACMCVHV